VRAAGGAVSEESNGWRSVRARSSASCSMARDPAAELDI
jgi:hypothetical protein